MGFRKVGVRDDKVDPAQAAPRNGMVKEHRRPERKRVVLGRLCSRTSCRLEERGGAVRTHAAQAKMSDGGVFNVSLPAAVRYEGRTSPSPSSTSTKRGLGSAGGKLLVAQSSALGVARRGSCADRP